MLKRKKGECAYDKNICRSIYGSIEEEKSHVGACFSESDNGVN
jgi:hypothetical protein